MPEVQTAVPGSKLAKLYGIKAQIITPSLEPVIVPVVLIDDISEREPTKRFAFGGGSLVAGVGELAQTALSLPNGANVLVSDIVFRFGTAAATLWEMSTGGPALAGGGTEEWQDRRLAGNPVAVVTEGVDVGALFEILRGNSAGSSFTTLAFPDVILGEAGSQKLHFAIASTNQALRYGWTWSEEPLTAEEEF